MVEANLGLAKRDARCWVCQHVSKVEHVTVLLIDEAGGNLPTRPAIDYLQSIGHNASARTWQQRLRHHRLHVLRSVAKGAVYSPVGVKKITTVTPQGGPPTWVRAPDRAMSIGMDALEQLQERLEEASDETLVAVARLGLTAAGMRGAWEAKGRQLGQLDALIDLAYESSVKDED